MASIPSKVSNLVAQKYQRGENTFSRVVKSAPERKIEIEIGDSKQPDFKPGFKGMWFNNEYNVSVRAEEDPLATVTTEGEKIVYTRSDGIKVVQYDKPDAGEEGGHELEWEIPSMPKFDGDFYRLKFTLRYKGNVKFYYQPALTQEEKDQGASRPENVEGSYAVYIDKSWHRITEIQAQKNYWTKRLYEEYPEDIELQARYKNIQTREQVDTRKQEILDQIEGFDILIEEDPQSGNNYGPGKLEHIYRPKAIDAEGNEAWCTLYIPDQGQAETNIEGWVDVPRSFLEKVDFSKGPVVVDPTFGYTSVGGSTESVNADFKYGSIAPINEDGSVESISFYGRANSGTRNRKAGVYSDNAGSANALLGTSNVTSQSTSVIWWTANFASSVSLAAGSYWLAVINEASGCVAYYDAGSSTNGFEDANTYSGGFEDPAAVASYYNRRFSIYATYTAGGGGDTNCKINIGDSWKDVSELKINIGDAWKAVTGIKINIGDVWKDIFG